MRTPLVYDGRNIYKLEDMYGVGVEYYSIGRPNVKITSEAIPEAAATRE